MKRAQKILELLYSRRGQGVSFSELSRASGLDVARIHAMLDDLIRTGQRLEILPTHGVLLHWPIRLDAHLIEVGLKTRRVGRHVICFDEVGSTNDVAFDSARQSRSDGLVILAESQRKGRGRLGRKWISPPGCNILMSVLLVDEQNTLAHEALTIAAGLAVAEGIDIACGVDCRLKWPNDVLLDASKLSGVLVEIKNVPLSSPGRGPIRKSRRCVVIGIGVNVNAAPPGSELTSPAVSLAGHVGTDVERVEVVREILDRLDYWIDCISRGELAALHDAWMARSDMIGRRISIRCEGIRYTGRVLDISPLEGLLLCRDEGPPVHLPARGSSLAD